MRVFLDANVLFTAAHNPRGLSNLLFELARHEVLTLVTSHHAIEEARTNLVIKLPDKVASLEALVPTLEVVDTPQTALDLLGLPDDDQLVFAAAVAGRATHLLTGDKKHFGPYYDDPTRTAGVRIQTVRQFFVDRFGLG